MNEKYKDTLWEVYKCEWGNMKYGGHGFGRYRLGILITFWIRRKFALFLFLFKFLNNLN